MNNQYNAEERAIGAAITLLDGNLDHENAITMRGLLSKLRAPVSDIREGFELTYAADADDPACASDLAHFTNGWRACIMSQVRAPVADERAAFEAWNSMHGQYRRSDAYQRLDNGNYVEWPVEHGWRVWQARAALASAPVAGDGKTRVPGDQLGGPAVAWDDGAQSDPNRPESRASIESKGGALAPVAGEAQPVCWIEKVELESVRDEGGDAWVHWCPAGHVAEHDEMPLYAAPQASEAVRDAAFEAVRKRLCAIPRFSFYLDDDGVVRRVEGRSGNWIEFDTVHALFDPVSVDAALSAQPGAQKEQHTDGGAVYG